jgi:hypothetical protein
MGLMDCVGKIVAQLLEDGLDPVIVLGYDELADDPFKPAACTVRGEFFS